MTGQCMELLKGKCEQKSYVKLMQLNNPKLHSFIAKYVGLCNPDSVYICNDSKEDRQYIRNKALELGESVNLPPHLRLPTLSHGKDKAKDYIG